MEQRVRGRKGWEGGGGAGREAGRQAGGEAGRQREREREREREYHYVCKICRKLSKIEVPC
jgi:hypothetical protein